MNINKIKKVALIQGGLGAEKEVSLLSAQVVAKAFKALNIPYTIVESDKHIVQKLSKLKPDYAFLATHGKYAEDGTLQGICEYLKIPYTGSGVLASSLCMDKCFFKNYISQHNISTPQYQNFNLENQRPQEVIVDIPYPFVVKPSREGSTIGISICNKKEELVPALKKAIQYDTKILVESYIKGMELAVSFLLGKVLTPVEIVPKNNFYDYESKYKSKETQYILPPRLEKKIIEECKSLVLQVVDISCVRAYCRVDFIIKENTTPLMIEMNTLPGLTAHSLLPKSAQYDGIDFNTLILNILKEAKLDYTHK